MTLRSALLACACLAQLVVAGSLLWRAEWALGGSVHRFETVPVDPVDLFRGRYVSIAFPRVSVPRGDDAPLAAPGDAFATVEPTADGLARLVRVYARAPQGEDVVPVKVLHASAREATVQLGFDRFYLPEEKAPALEAAIRDARGRAVAVVRVRGSDAVLEDLQVEPAAAEVAPLRDRIRVPVGGPLPEALLAALKAPPSWGLERCGPTATCVVFPIELDGEPEAEYVLLSPDAGLHYYVPAPPGAGAPAYAWKARLEPRAGARLPTADALLSALAEGGAGVSAAAPAYRDLRIGDATFGVPH